MASISSNLNSHVGNDPLHRTKSFNSYRDSPVNKECSGASVQSAHANVRAPLTTPQQSSLVEKAERSLAEGLELRDWWESCDTQHSYVRQFDLTRTFNSSGTSFGFFDTARIGERDVAVMGEVEDRVFDFCKSSNVSRIRDELREFVLKYLMRVSDFRRPEASVDQDVINRSAWLQPVSWCANEYAQREGFGYSQYYYKPRNSHQIGEFPSAWRYEIVDLRELARKYEWLLLSVRILDFSVSAEPFGKNSLHVTLPLHESSMIVTNSEFIWDQSHPETDSDSRVVIGKYGFGYSFIKGREDEILGYGPGQFDVAFQQIVFRIYEDGEVRVKLVFVANRPSRVSNVPLSPIDWLVSLAKLASLGIANEGIDAIRPALRRFPFNFGNFDPVFTGVSLANLLTGNQASRQLCISREQLEKTFLVKHFDQHYEMINGALQTWREIPDWTNEAALPEWVKTGVSS